LRLSGLLALARALRTDGVILCYHNVVPDGDPGSDSGLGLHMPRATFARQLRWLSANYTIVSLEEFVARRGRGASLRGLAALTFDDAYAGVFACAWPLLQELGIPATVFVVSDAPARQATFWWDHPGLSATSAAAHPDEWLTTLRGDGAAILRAAGCHNRLPHVPPAHRAADWATIAAAARAGLGIGAHSATHRALPALDPVELRREVGESRETLAARAGVTPEFFAYPYGLWSDRVRDAVRAAGYAAAFTLERAARRTDRWSLPRVNIPAGIGDAAFQAWTAGLQLRRGA
jgi:peptidoglycan/xylan/chitin deacetylase (PgdA/CDA1 family)